MISDAKLVETFSDVIDSAVAEAVTRKLPLSSKSGEYVVGDITIIKDKAGFQVKDLDCILYDGLYLFESAYLLAYYKKSLFYKKHQEVFHMELDYQKHRKDLEFYSHQFLEAKRNKEFDIVDIIRARSEISLNRAIIIKNSLRKMCGILIGRDKYHK